MYPFKLIFPSKTVRQYYLRDQAQKDEWISAFKQAIGHTNIFDYYDLYETLGQGRYGQVKAAIHRRTGK